MKIHAIHTGTVAITRRWREGVGHGRRRLVNTLLDRDWTEPPPSYAFAIEHPEGVIVVDTGETARVSGLGYFPRWQPFVPFPGHSPGPLAVVVEDGDHAVLVAADSSYAEDALLRGVVDGVVRDEAAERLSHERIRAFAGNTATVYLPTHDPETAARLAERRPIGAAREEAIA